MNNNNKKGNNDKDKNKAKNKKQKQKQTKKNTLCWRLFRMLLKLDLWTFVTNFKYSQRFPQEFDLLRSSFSSNRTLMQAYNAHAYLTYERRRLTV